MRRILLYGCLIVFWMLWEVGETLAQQANPMRAPATPQRTEPPAAPSADGTLPALVFDAYLRFFQQVISPVDGARSNMYPTGSAYARQAIKKHGALVGIVLTTERLMHEGNEDQVAPRIRKYGLWRVHDPVEANDWWWYGPDWVYQPASDSASRQ
jgi:putative component of membrane protein insertase Oxa1/YidC/SpoIIIJ protein YidD